MDKFHKNKYRFSSIKPLMLISDEIIEFRNQQIIMLTSELLKYKVLLRDLIKDNVSYSIRNELLNIAMFITSNIELYDEFIKQQDIPVNAVGMATRVNAKYIKKYSLNHNISVWTIKNKEELILINNPNYQYICNNLPYEKSIN